MWNLEWGTRRDHPEKGRGRLVDADRVTMSMADAMCASMPRSSMRSISARGVKKMGENEGEGDNDMLGLLGSWPGDDIY